MGDNNTIIVDFPSCDYPSTCVDFFYAKATCLKKAEDNAADPAYDSGGPSDDGWVTGDNGGCGFGPWTIPTEGFSSATIAPTTSIIASDEKMFSIHSSADDQDGSVTAERRLPAGEPLCVGEKFSFDWVVISASGGSTQIGIRLKNSASQTLWALESSNGADYTYTNGTNPTEMSEIPATPDIAMHICFELKAATEYEFSVIDLTNSITYGPFIGSLASSVSPKIIDRICFVCQTPDPNSGDQAVAYFNNLCVERGWKFDLVEQPTYGVSEIVPWAPPYCLCAADAAFLPRDTAARVLNLDAQENLLSIQDFYVPSTQIIQVSSFDSEAVHNDHLDLPSLDPFDQTLECVPGTYNDQDNTWTIYAGAKAPLPNEMCPEEDEPGPSADNIIYVKVAGSGTEDGSSWANAATLSAAIAAAGDGDELWLQRGTYKPTVTLSVTKGTRIYGGFQGNETERSERNPDPATNMTIVDGTDITSGSNVFGATAISSDTLTVYDGLTVQNGADALPNPVRAIQYANGGEVIVRNSIFRNNRRITEQGGAVNILTSIATLCDVHFENNRAASGGAVLIQNTDAPPRVYNVSFVRNESTGGGVNQGGGALRLANANDIVLINCEFFENTARAGGAILSTSTTPGGEPTMAMIQCTFVANSASTLSSSTATTGGAGVYLNGSNVNLTSLTVDVRNCIFWNNISDNGSDPPDAEDITAFGSMADVSVCDFIKTDDDSFKNFGSAPAIMEMDGKVGDDPLFVDEANGDLRLQKASPARDCGENNALLYADCDGSVSLLVDVNVDLQRTARIFNVTVDLGAYEWAPDVDCFEALLCWNGGPPVPCVHGDTLVLMGDGSERPIRDVRAGDLVRTHDGRDVPLVYNVRIHTSRGAKGTDFIRFAPGSLSPGLSAGGVGGEDEEAKVSEQSVVPSADFFIRRGHPLLVNGKEVECQDCVTGGEDIVHETRTDVWEVYTLCTESAAGDFILMQGGVPVKTWDATGFDEYTRTHEVGKRLIYNKL